MSTKMKAITVRLPQNIYAASSKIAQKRKMSVNRLVQESLEATLKLEQEQQLYQAFGELSGEENEVEFALGAQREVVLDDKE